MNIKKFKCSSSRTTYIHRTIHKYCSFWYNITQIKTNTSFTGTIMRVFLKKDVNCRDHSPLYQFVTVETTNWYRGLWSRLFRLSIVDPYRPSIQSVWWTLICWWTWILGLWALILVNSYTGSYLYGVDVIIKLILIRF